MEETIVNTENDTVEEKIKKERIKKIKEFCNITLKKFIEITKTIFMKPADTIQKHASEENYLFGWSFIVVNCIFMGIMVYILSLKSTIPFYEFIFSDKLIFNTFFSVFRIILTVSIYAFVGYFTIASMIKITSSVIYETRISFKKIVALVGICTVITSISAMIVSVMIFMSVKFAVMIIALSFAFYWIVLSQTIFDLDESDPNKAIYVIFITIVATIFMLTMILPELF